MQRRSAHALASLCVSNRVILTTSQKTYGNDSVQCVYGLVNILFWPSSIVWAAPQGAIDAGTLNEREMLYYYRYNKYGKKALEERGLKLD